MRQRCETCPTIGDCKQAFGRYWMDKSSNGNGCNHPFAYNRGISEKPTTRPPAPIPAPQPEIRPKVIAAPIVKFRSGRRNKSKSLTQGELI